MSHACDRLTDKEIQRVVYWLRESELTFGQIAAKFGVGNTVVRKINEKYGVREYGGSHTFKVAE